MSEVWKLTSMTHEDVDRFGLGCTSLAELYAHRNATALIEAPCAQPQGQEKRSALCRC